MLRSLVLALLALASLPSARAASFAASSDPNDCQAFCTREYEPVCGSNGVTYGNECMLQAAQCANATLTKAKDGRC